MAEIRSLPTTYNGVRFRSRLEAAWARAFDDRRIKWTYEPEGWAFGPELCYLPDFFLPDLQTIVEVKGILDARSIQKLAALEKAASINRVFVVLCEAPAGDRWALVGPDCALAYRSGFDLCPNCHHWQFFGQDGCRACEPERCAPTPWLECKTIAERIAWCRWWGRGLIDAGRMDEAEEFMAEAIKIREMA